MQRITIEEFNKLKEKREHARVEREKAAAAEKNKKKKKEEPKEEPQESEKVEENLKQNEEAEEPQEAPAKKSRKPANRKYMVTEDIETVND